MVLAHPAPERLENGLEAINSIGVGAFSERRQSECGHGAHLLLRIREAMRDDFHQLGKKRKDRAAKENGDLLNSLDAGVSRIPGLPRLTHCLKERKHRRHAESRSDDCEGPAGGVADVVVRVVNVGPDGGEHRRQPSCLAQIGDDLARFDPGIKVLVDEHRLDHHQDLVRVRPHEFIEAIEHSVNNLHEEMALLVLERGRHEQRKDLVEKRPCTKLARMARDLAQSGLAL
mmetsp:Transcript_10364/g.33072  ORF Transcript_10364/g.33072 Transcript_10364/m.33072 type:complete len:230 (-) Transcript_10364:245-934(-)